MAVSDLDTLFQGKRFTEAEALLRQQLSTTPGDAAARYNLSLALARQGRLAEALQDLQPLLQGKPETHVLHAAVKLLLALRRPAEAIPLAKLLVQRRSTALEPQLILAMALRLAGKLSRAERAARDALRLNPKSAEAMAELAFTLLGRGQREEAAAMLKRSLELSPGDETRQRALADLLMKSGRPVDALAGYKTIAARATTSLDSVVGMLRSARIALDWTAEADALKRLREALNDPQKRFWLPTQLAIFFGFTAPELLVIARRYAARLQKELPLPAPAAAARPADERLRIAYVSPSFRQHSLWNHAGEVFAAHDRARFAVAGFALNANDGSPACREVGKAFEHAAFLPDPDERATAEAIAAWAPDILVDLAGYAEGARPTAVRIAPAAYKLAWPAMPGTSGAPWMQGFLSDAVATPEGLEPAFSETVVRLSRSAFPSRALAAEPRTTRAEAGLPEKALVLAAFHSGRKIDRESFQLWTRILRRTEGTVLWLQSMGEGAQRGLRQRAQQSGLAPERLIFAPGLPWRQHLGRLALADLALDALVFGSHSSASDALRVGVPVLTVAGDAPHRLTVASMLTHLGLPDLVSPSAEGMEELAIGLLEDGARLGQVKATLAILLGRASLFDPKGFAQNLEKLYLGLAGRR
jgi:protein O-GlcNAc transferase